MQSDTVEKKNVFLHMSLDIRLNLYILIVYESIIP